jgi:hypothetical protein
VIHQPQYLPYLGYFYKMSLADVFVSLDRAAYSSNKVQNRNVIRGPNGPIALTVPVRRSGHFGTPLSEIAIDNSGPWARKHWRSIEQSYRRYPYFAMYAGELKLAYERTWERLVDLNLHLTALLMRWLEISVPVVRSSDLLVEGHSTQMLVEICKEVGATTYVSGQRAKAYLEPERFLEAGIRLWFSTFRHPEYRQPVTPFVAELSALDLVMSEGPQARDVIAAARALSDVVEWAPTAA